MPWVGRSRLRPCPDDSWADGSKLSKARHGALGIEAIADMGYLPEALRQITGSPRWGHGDDEIIDTAQAIACSISTGSADRTCAARYPPSVTNLKRH